MSKLLYIKANPKSNQDSHTFRMSESFIEAYKEVNPQDEIIILDLYKEGIKFLDGEMLASRFSGEEHSTLKYAQQFAEADKYVIAAPLWNLGSPAIVKAYIDYVMVPGVVFRYTEQGPIGLLADQGKKAVHISACGGNFSNSDQLGDRYLRSVFGFMGIKDFTTLVTELTGVLQGEALEGSVSKSVEQALALAKRF